MITIVGVHLPCELTFVWHMCYMWYFGTNRCLNGDRFEETQPRWKNLERKQKKVASWKTNKKHNHKKKSVPNKQTKNTLKQKARIIFKPARPWSRSKKNVPKKPRRIYIRPPKSVLTSHLSSPAKGIPDLSDLIGQTLGTQLLVALTWRSLEIRHFPIGNTSTQMDGGFSSQLC